MASTYETGHAKNVANFETLISFVTGYGAVYNPSRVSIQLAGLQTKATDAKNAVDNLNSVLASYGNTVASREIAFAPIQKLGTRIINALKATDTPAAVIDNLTTLNRKLQGRRASAKLSEEEKAALQAQGKEVNQVSASQQSFDSVLDTFDKEVKLLASIPQYTPNETELTVATLQALYTTLKSENEAVVNVSTTLSNARLARNQVMYHPESGLVATATDIKSYVKSIYGASSPQYKQISALAFKAIKP